MAILQESRMLLDKKIGLFGKNLSDYIKQKPNQFIIYLLYEGRYDMNKKVFTVIIICIIGGTGCTTTTFTYTNPSGYQIETKRLVPVAFSEFWVAYTKELSKGSFVIDNIEKEDRIINLSFGSDIPSEYIDCGYSDRTYYLPSLGKKSFGYKVADSASYQAGVSELPWSVNKDTSLTGSTNISMTPKGDQTLLFVNTLYDWSASVQAISILGSRKDMTSIVFSSEKTGQGLMQNIKAKCDNMWNCNDDWIEKIKIQCRSKGILERKLLDLVEVEDY